MDIYVKIGKNNKLWYHSSVWMLIDLVSATKLVLKTNWALVEVMFHEMIG